MSGIPEVHLSKDVLLAEAERQTGLSDWGAQPFEPGLDVLLDAIEQEAQLNGRGRFGVWNGMVRMLSNWLQLQADDYRNLPTDEREMIFVLGPARSGTTVLQRLLCLDSRAGFLRYADGQFPTPATALGTTLDAEKLERSSKLTQTMYQVLPEMLQMHEMQPAMPDEEAFLFEHQFICGLFPLRMSVPTYEQWFLTTDWHTESYRELRRLLSYIGQHREFSYWVLKAPQHLFTLDVLLKSFPNAKLIWIHRDPVRSMASLSNLCWRIRKLNTDVAKPSLASRDIIAFMHTGVMRSMAVREQVGDNRFCDVYYHDLMTDPVAEVRRIYAALGMAFSSQMEVAILEWLDANPQDKHGRHRYSLEEFGLSADKITSQFSDYIDRFSIPTEPA